MKKMRFAFALLSVLMAGAANAAADAAAMYPSKPIELIVPFAPGGGTDIVARLIGPRMAEVLGQTVVVVNKPGAGGTIGSDNVAKSAPDGYTLAFATSSTHGAAPSVYKNLPYDAVESFQPVSLLVSTPFMLAVRKDLPANSVRELIELANEKKDKLNYASPGTGSSNQLAMEMLRLMAGVELVHVPYKGSGPALSDLAGGQVDLTINDLASLAGFLEGGRIRGLAVTSLKRNNLYPDLPTIDEAGVPGYEALAWYGLLAPKDTPPAIVEKLENAVNLALQDDKLRKSLTDLGFEIRGEGPEPFRHFIQNEVKKWAKVVEASGATAD